MTSPLISVVVPAYNYGHFLPQTLDSLQSQTCREWECVVVDDGSSDNTREVVESYADADPRVRYVYQENRGLGESRNTGLRHARGRYFQFLDADDMLEPEKFEFQVGHLESHPATDIVYGGVRYFTTENLRARLGSMCGAGESWMPEVSGGAEVLSALLRRNIMVVNAPLVRRGVVEAVGFFDGNPVGLEDWDYWLRCALAGSRFEFRDGEGARALVRTHPSSMSRNRRLMLESELKVRRKLLRAGLPDEARRLNRLLLAEEAGWLGVEQVAEGDLRGGVQHLLAAGAASPRVTTKLRWAACACLSPFVQREALPQLATLPLPRVCGLLLRRMKR